MALHHAGRRSAALILAITLTGCNSGGHGRPLSGHGGHSSASRGSGTHLGEPGGNWGSPVFADDFSGNRLDTSKWQIYNAPDAATHPGTTPAPTSRAATSCS